VDGCGRIVGMTDGYRRGELPLTRTARQVDVLTAFVAARGSVADAAASIGIRPSTAKRHMADLRARSGLSTEQLIYRGRAEGWLVVPALEPPTPVPPELHDSPATGRPERKRLRDHPVRRGRTRTLAERAD
jgi:predicted ArsR family transcriptional regulator